MRRKQIPLVRVSKEDKRSTSVQESLDHFSSRENATYPVSLGECHLDEDGIFTLAREKVQLTDLSYRSLLQRLNIPYSFAHENCPIDLGVDIVNRLLRERKDDKVSCWCDMKNNTLESITSIDFSPIRHCTFLSAFAEVFGPADAFEIVLSVTELRLLKLFELKADPVPGDYFQFGLEFINYDVFSETRYLQAEAFLFRLVCSNGSKVRSVLNNFSDMFKPPITEVALRDGMKRISFSDEETKGIFCALKWMETRKIGPYRDQIFRLFKRMAKKYMPMPEENPFSSENTYYDIFNHVTQAIQNKDVPLIRRRQVESWAGSLIDAYLIAKNEGRQAATWEDVAIPV